MMTSLVIKTVAWSARHLHRCFTHDSWQHTELTSCNLDSECLYSCRKQSATLEYCARHYMVYCDYSHGMTSHLWHDPIIAIAHCWSACPLSPQNTPCYVHI